MSSNTSADHSLSAAGGAVTALPAAPAGGRWRAGRMRTIGGGASRSGGSAAASVPSGSTSTRRGVRDPHAAAPGRSTPRGRGPRAARMPRPRARRAGSPRARGRGRRRREPDGPAELELARQLERLVRQFGGAHSRPCHASASARLPSSVDAVGAVGAARRCERPLQPRHRRSGVAQVEVRPPDRGHARGRRSSGRSDMWMRSGTLRCPSAPRRARASAMSLFEVDLRMRPELHARREVGTSHQLRAERRAPDRPARRAGSPRPWRRAPGHALEDPVEQLGIHPRRADVRRHEREPPRDGGRLAALVDLAAAAEDQVEGAIPPLRRRGGTRSRRRCRPGPSATSRRRRGAWTRPRASDGPQAISQEIAEEVVESVLIRLARHRDDEHGVVLELPQERARRRRSRRRSSTSPGLISSRTDS